jgi:hypothetical protein
LTNVEEISERLQTDIACIVNQKLEFVQSLHRYVRQNTLLLLVCTVNLPRINLENRRLWLLSWVYGLFSLSENSLRIFVRLAEISRVV